MLYWAELNNHLPAILAKTRNSVRAARRKFLFIDFIYMRSKVTHSFIHAYNHMKPCRIHCTHTYTDTQIQIQQNVYQITKIVDWLRSFRCLTFLLFHCAIRSLFYSLGFFLLCPSSTILFRLFVRSMCSGLCADRLRQEKNRSAVSNWLLLRNRI